MPIKDIHRILQIHSPLADLFMCFSFSFSNSLEDNPKTLLIDEIEADKNYELVLTTTTGLYRYRNGDVIRIKGFHDKCPVYRMKYRYMSM